MAEHASAKGLSLRSRGRSSKQLFHRRFAPWPIRRWPGENESGELFFCSLRLGVSAVILPLRFSDSYRAG